MATRLDGAESVLARAGGLLSRLLGSEGQSRAMGRSRWLSNVYLNQLVPALLLVLVGAVVIWSASLTIEEASFPRQLIGIAAGLVCAWLMWRYDYRSLVDMSTVLIVMDVVLILLPNVPGLGVEAKGMTGWVRIPLVGVTFQPSELTKIVTIFLMASLAAEYNGKIDSLHDYLKLCGILAGVFILMIMQDLGTGLILLVVGASIIVCGGAKRTWVLVTLGVVIVGALLVVATSMVDGLPHILKTYQLNRLLVFIDSSVDPTGDGYNLQQAKIAVGSGGFFGKGVGNASQSSGGFLPEAHTDFVFALFAEEFGFFGSVVLLGLFGWMIFSTVMLAQRIDVPFAKLVLVGVATMWAFQVLQNVGMCIGLMPITGIPLPFISFGSSSLIAQLTACGMVQSVWHYRTKAA